MQSKSLNVAVVDTNPIRAAILCDGLQAAGIETVHVIRDTTGVMRVLADLAPDVVIIDLEDPNRDVLEQMFQVSRSVSRPVAMFVDQSDASMIEAAIDAGVSAYIVDGLRADRVKPIVDMAISRFNAFARLRRELDETRQELADRKTVDRAKGLLMRAKGLGEAEAYALLRSTAMKQSRKIIDVAESIILAADLLGPKGDAS
ncbi:two-component system response regulator [Alsobacter soli]|uniref:Two-component system response regulator n=1 Tax=Alsobacter soli TaxID=2109933 RepID=A0A2T1HX93_9HYPH|nr:ANTAR domain-containing protein [Alsobacter soli]PSC06302.1 two-component system response regulator [Alsobacter soli]